MVNFQCITDIQVDDIKGQLTVSYKTITKNIDDIHKTIMFLLYDMDHITLSDMDRTKIKVISGALNEKVDPAQHVVLRIICPSVLFPHWIT